MLPLSIIIPTKDRPYFLEKTISNLINNNKFFFNEILVVDSSSKKYKKKIIQICKNKKIKLFFSLPSISRQRNIGIKKVKKKNKYIMFLDDDLQFNKNSFRVMRKKINILNDKYCGLAFNISKKDNLSFLNKIKNSLIIKNLGLYHPEPGKILSSGWHSKMTFIKKDTDVEWISTQAVIFLKEKLENIRFDEFFSDYSYLEDLDLSINVRKYGKLKVIHDAQYNDINEIERSGYRFGKKEIINKFYLVSKHKLNTKLFFISAIIKALLNLTRLKKKFFFQFIGNIVAISICLLSLIKK